MSRVKLQLGEKRYRELYGADDKLKVFDHLIIKPGEHPLAPFVGKGKTKVAPPSGTKPVPRRTMLFDEKSQMMRAFAEIQTLVGKAWDTRGLGSNNWVLAPSRSKSGHALLANDPHLAILTPSFWHEVHLTAPGLDVMGVAVPGTTAVVSGHNRHLAWGITNGYSNAADIVAVQPKKGVFQLGSKTIKVEKFSPTVWVRIGFLHVPIFWKSFYRTSHGPFLPIQWIQKKKLLLKFSGYHLKESPLYAISRLMRAKSAREADESLKLMKLPNWNLVFADTRGNIGYRQVGLVPRRKSGTYGLLDPTKPKQLWDGFLKDHETAALLNPKRGFIATANNRTFPIHFPFFLGHAFVEGYRAKRIEALIRKTPKHTIASMQKIQLDVKVPGAEILLDTMLAILAKQTLTAESKQAVKLLSRWDKLATREQVAPTLFRLWFLFLEEALFENDSKGRSGLPFQTKVKPGYPAVKRVLKGTLKVKTKNPIGVVVRLSLEKTIEKLKKDLGGSMTDWKWRNYHRMYFFHQLGPHLTTRPKDRGVVGDEHTVNLSQNRGGGPFRVKVGPSYRLVVELSPKRIRSFGVLAGKQVDVQPRVLGEQQQMWIEGKYRPRPFYPDDLAKYKKSEKTLTW